MLYDSDTSYHCDLLFFKCSVQPSFEICFPYLVIVMNRKVGSTAYHVTKWAVLIKSLVYLDRMRPSTHKVCGKVRCCERKRSPRVSEYP